jgi:NTE family protein
MKKSPLFLFFLVILFSQSFFAQSEKPRVALVLSGGGAKGIAHIPLLQTLDSLGIVPDILIGTSMGSVVGGLYAAGYSGDSISTLAHEANWSQLLGGDIALEDVSMEEKSEFKRYLVDFDIREGKPKVNSGLLKDQKLREFLSSYLYPVYNIKDFDDLPIPYRAMTTDIVNGKEFLFDSGSLGLAMRASMSIPGVFEPIRYDSTLLVDGGVMNNFPVNVAKEMGYDIIIGSDVGGGMQKIDKLNSIPSLLFQAGMLTSNLKNPQNRADCDILIDHIPYITYSTGDFSKADDIYLEGKRAVSEKLDDLVALADQLKQFRQRNHQVPAVKNEFQLDSIVYKGISEANLALVKARSDIEQGNAYSVEEIIAGVDRAMGTNLFNQINYDPELENGRLKLTLNGVERSRNIVKGALHYDNYRTVGVLVNYTSRNVFGKASRFLVTADIAVQPRFRVQYQKLFGKKKRWWWRSEVLGEFLEQKFYFSGEVAENMKSQYIQFDNQFNWNLTSHNSYLGLGISADKSVIKPKLTSAINENVLGLERYSFTNLEIDLHYQFNDLNDVFYPTRGMYLRTSVGRTYFNDMEFIFLKDLRGIEQNLDPIIGKTNSVTKLRIDMEKRWDFSEKVTGILGVNFDYMFEDPLKDDELSFTYFGHGGLYFLGGTVTQPRKDTYSFAGLHEDELTVSQMTRLVVGLQLNLFPKLFITPNVNVATVGFGDFDPYFKKMFSPEGKWSEAIDPSFIFTSGINLGYRSFLGPVNFGASYANDIDKVRLFFNIGILFNRSN